MKSKKVQSGISPNNNERLCGRVGVSGTSVISRKIYLLCIMSLIIFVALVYANSLKGPFIFDDEILIKNNPLIRSLVNIPVFFKTDLFAHSLDGAHVSNSYRPLQTLTYTIEYFLWGNDPFGFHLTNILLHLVNVLLLFSLVKRLFGNTFLAYFTALLFGVSPVNTACVSYISGRADVLTATFMLMSFSSYVKFTKNCKKSFFIISALLYLCAVYTREYAIVVLPLIIVLYNILFIEKKSQHFYSLFYLPVLLLYFPARIMALSGMITQNLELSGIDFFSRIITAVKTLFLDIRIILFPYDLHFGRTVNIEYFNFRNFFTIAGTVFALFMIGLFLRWAYDKWAREKNINYGILFFGISWFFISMLPLLNIVPLQVFCADSWLYFSSIGILLICVMAISKTPLLSSSANAKAFLKFLSFLILTVMVVSYGFMTIERNNDYCDEIRFYRSSLKWRPNVKFYAILSALYGRRNDTENVIKCAKKAIEINDIYPSDDVIQAYYNLGIAYMNQKKYSEAKVILGKVLNSNNEHFRNIAGKVLKELR